MELQDLQNKILVKQTMLRVEQDPTKRAKLAKELQVLQLRKEILTIKVNIAKLER